MKAAPSLRVKNVRIISQGTIETITNVLSKCKTITQATGESWTL